MATVQALRGIYVQRVEGRTYMIWDPNADDAISRAAWLSITKDMARQKEGLTNVHHQRAQNRNCR